MKKQEMERLTAKGVPVAEGVTVKDDLQLPN